MAILDSAKNLDKIVFSNKYDTTRAQSLIERNQSAIFSVKNLLQKNNLCVSDSSNQSLIYFIRMVFEYVFK